MNPYHLPLVLVSLVLPACGLVNRGAARFNHHPYHANGNAVETVPCAAAYCRSSTLTPKLGFLEFDDQGEPWDPAQLAQIQNEMRKLQKQNIPLRTIIFIHGWNNNASDEKDGNLESFRDALWRIQDNSENPVFGIYVGWRGKALPFQSFIDGGDREATAQRIAGGPLLASLTKISKITHDTCGRVTLIGHSFGAKITAHITSAHLASQVAQDNPRPLADLTVLANTAEHGIVARHIVGLMNDHNLVFKNPGTNQNIPIVVAVGSKADWPVRMLLPTWNVITRDILTFGFPHKAGASRGCDQSRSLYTGMAFVRSLRSHEFERTGTASNIPIASSDKDEALSQAWNQTIQVNMRNGRLWARGEQPDLQVSLYEGGDLETPQDYILKSIGNPANSTSFWLTVVPEFVINSHGDIWNSNFYGLIAALEAASNSSKEAPPPPSRILESIPLRAPLPVKIQR